MASHRHGAADRPILHREIVIVMQVQPLRPRLKRRRCERSRWPCNWTLRLARCDLLPRWARGLGCEVAQHHPGVVGCAMPAGPHLLRQPRAEAAALPAVLGILHRAAEHRELNAAMVEPGAAASGAEVRGPHGDHEEAARLRECLPQALRGRGAFPLRHGLHGRSGDLQLRVRSAMPPPIKPTGGLVAGHLVASGEAAAPGRARDDGDQWRFPRVLGVGPRLEVGSHRRARRHHKEQRGGTWAQAHEAHRAATAAAAGARARWRSRSPAAPRNGAAAAPSAACATGAAEPPHQRCCRWRALRLSQATRTTKRWGLRGRRRCRA
mmetsp:Transcript_106145/g.297128  ORF Transcript_106145/g.297128 Transcript_106145/m.297128 type:complete len:323 (+) Transcript_106145:510-1478(+)